MGLGGGGGSLERTRLAARATLAPAARLPVVAPVTHSQEAAFFAWYAED